jgi:3-isopropylmalate/(R)-2-methylmalate dehydratase large subunit
MGKTLIEKLWSSHVVTTLPDGTDVLYVDRIYCHEVTSPQAFGELERRGLKVHDGDSVICMPDHTIPSKGRKLDEASAKQVEALCRNAGKHGLKHFGAWDERSNGIVHVVGPELGLTQPGMVVVCGDSHTSTHGALGTLSFGIGTSELGMALGTQCVLGVRPKTMRIAIEGKLGVGVSAKDVALYIINKVGTGGGTGYFIEYAGSTVSEMSVEGRLTLCNMSIEMGARGGMVGADMKTMAYVSGKRYSPKGVVGWGRGEEYIEEWKTDADAVFDAEYKFRAEEVPVMVTWGTNPGQGMSIDGKISAYAGEDEEGRASHAKALAYMGFAEGEQLLGKPVDYVFMGSCTNGRLEDFEAFAGMVKGKQKAEGVEVWVVPGSWSLYKRIKEDANLGGVLEAAGIEVRNPGCSACLAMNGDKVGRGKYALSTSNRNFEGRQGPGARTLLAGPLAAGAAAVTGVVTDPRGWK